MFLHIGQSTPGNARLRVPKPCETARTDHSVCPVSDPSQMSPTTGTTHRVATPRVGDSVGLHSPALEDQAKRACLFLWQPVQQDARSLGATHAPTRLDCPMQSDYRGGSPFANCANARAKQHSAVANPTERERPKEERQLACLRNSDYITSKVT